MPSIRRSWSTDRRGQRLFAEAQRIHLAHYAQPCFWIQRQARLIEKTVCPCPTRLAGRLKANPCFLDPDAQRPRAGSKGYRSVAHARTRLKHQTDDAANGTLHPHSMFVDQDKGA